MRSISRVGAAKQISAGRAWPLPPARFASPLPRWGRETRL